MAATCSYCYHEFTSQRGLFRSQDAVSLRDAHVQGCRQNPRNKCFCGRVFPDVTSRDRHAAQCEVNPANNFKCPHCPQEFMTTFGVMGFMSSDGRAQRDWHAGGCKGNPANTCYCGLLFPHADARNAHALKCEMNPANCFKCKFCSGPYVTTYHIFGFKRSDGRAVRDSHEAACEKNPRNICFCGRIFQNSSAKDKHAEQCEANPSNRFACPHCALLFITRYGVMGLLTSDGNRLRQIHEQGCEKNSKNACFCGELFPHPAARNAHATKCDKNPANRFGCRYCQEMFITTFGLFTSCGASQRDAHQSICCKNPANATCGYCNETFADTHGWLVRFRADAQRRCRSHMALCSHNPQNRFSCEKCDRCFKTRRRWLKTVDGRKERDVHQAECDVIPCTYDVLSTEVTDWHLLASGEECREGSELCGDCDLSEYPEPSEAASVASLSSPSAARLSEADSLGQLSNTDSASARAAFAEACQEASAVSETETRSSSTSKEEEVQEDSDAASEAASSASEEDGEDGDSEESEGESEESDGEPETSENLEDAEELRATGGEVGRPVEKNEDLTNFSEEGCLQGSKAEEKQLEDFPDPCGEGLGSFAVLAIPLSSSSVEEALEEAWEDLALEPLI